MEGSQNLARQLDDLDFQYEVLQMHLAKLPSELFSAGQRIASSTFEVKDPVAKLKVTDTIAPKKG